jgi:plasmid stabilization system protein ParE
MKVRYTPQARGDLEAILQYLSSHSPQGMGNLKRALENTERLITPTQRKNFEGDGRACLAGRAVSVSRVLDH